MLSSDIFIKCECKIFPQDISGINLHFFPKVVEKIVVNFHTVNWQLVPDQTYTNFGGVFGCFLKGYNLHRNRDDTLATEGWSRLQFSKDISAKNNSFHSLATANVWQWTTCWISLALFLIQLSVFSLLIIPHFSFVWTLWTLPRVYSAWCACLIESVWTHNPNYKVSEKPCLCGDVKMCMRRKRYSVGHRYELCILQTEILKIYFFLSANYNA